MKKKCIFGFFLGVFTIIATSLSAQPGKHGTGPDSTECRQRLSFYRSHVTSGDLASAVSSWRIALALCPRTVNQFLFVDGQKIIKEVLMRQPGITAQYRSELIDSLMLMYDVRIEFYPANRISALQNKIVEMGTFLPDAKEERLAELEKLINLTGDRTFPDMLSAYMGLVATLYNEEKRSAEDMMDAYSRLIAILELQEKAKPDDAEVKKHKLIVENLFIGSGVATCENLIALFTPRFEANSDDLELVSKIVSLLSGSDCVTSDLFVQSLTVLNRLSPSYKTAFYLYRLHLGKGEYAEAAKTLREAINGTDITEEEKGAYLIEEGVLYYRHLNSSSRAMSSARAAIEASSSVRGKAYLLIASIWAGQKCGDDDIEKRAPFWVAVDYLNKAKAADRSCTEEADRMIAQYRQYFPLQEDAFMYDLTDGAEYTVTCNGFRETTTVRTRK